MVITISLWFRVYINSTLNKSTKSSIFSNKRLTIIYDTGTIFSLKGSNLSLFNTTDTVYLPVLLHLHCELFKSPYNSSILDTD